MVICKCDTAGYFEGDREISHRVCGDKNEVFLSQTLMFPHPDVSTAL